MTTATLDITLPLDDEAATRRLGEDLALALTAGDTLALQGDLGAGKSTLARALLRARADTPDLEVPSPTFTLIQTYELPRGPVAHADLYRLGDVSELAELGLEDLSAEGILLVEWPDRAEGTLPGRIATIELGIVTGTESRTVRIRAAGDLARRLARTLAIRDFLKTAAWPRARRRFLQGDASARAYERVFGGVGQAVLMNAPRQPDGPPVRDGLPYSRIAHLAEDVRPFVAIGSALSRRGISAPGLIAADLDQGLLLLEDLGAEPVVAEGAPIPERYEAAIDLLAAFHTTPMPSTVPLPDGSTYALPGYDARAMGIETELLLDWYLPHATGGRLPAEAEAAFKALWAELFTRLESAEQRWVLRDYHSPNLIWLPERAGIQRVGVIDFQDAVIGPSAYDVASLAQDARVTVPWEMEKALVDRYIALRTVADPAFEADRFRDAYAIMAAQRATKILGIFARLNHRDGKPAYLAHIPRVAAYLMRALENPVLSGLRRWYEQHLPDL
ncbi:tRNA (adenosine(37)-N6)-threonylcarbamoyltransferase complex ATPase subunit type 1 TsaE [Segnochrobactraceae bacterium EtOH-i3]